jgi:hypothetical protein
MVFFTSNSNELISSSKGEMKAKEKKKKKKNTLAISITFTHSLVLFFLPTYKLSFIPR